MGREGSMEEERRLTLGVVSRGSERRKDMRWKGVSEENIKDDKRV